MCKDARAVSKSLFRGVGLCAIFVGVALGQEYSAPPQTLPPAIEFPESPFQATRPRVANRPSRPEVPPNPAPATSTSIKNPTYERPLRDSAFAERTPPSPVGASPARPPLITKNDVGQRTQMVQQEKDLDEATRTELLKRMQKVGDQLQKADEAAARTAQFAADILQAPKLLSELKVQLATPLAEPLIEQPNDSPVGSLQQRLEQVETLLAEAQAEFSKREIEVKRRAERQAELTRQFADLAQKLQDVRQTRSRLESGTEAPIVALVGSTELDVRETLLERQFELAQTEAQRIESWTELFPLLRDAARRNVVAREKELAAWQQVVAAARQAESVRQADDARRQVQAAHPSLKQLAERNQQLAELRRGHATAIEQVMSGTRQLNKQLAQLTGEYDKLQEKVARVGMSKTIGILLRKQRADLYLARTRSNESIPAGNLSISSVQANVEVLTPHDWLRFVEREIPAAQLTLIELEDERSALGDTESVLRELLASIATSTADDERQMVEQTAADVLATKRDLLDKTIQDHNTYLRELSELEYSSRKLVEQTRTFMAFIDQNVLWIRSAEPLGPSDLRRSGRGIAHVFDTRLWLSLADKTLAGLWRRPWQGSTVLLIVLVLIVLRHRMWNRLQLLCATETGTSALNFVPTLEALLLAVVTSSVWPCLMWCAGWWLELSYEVDAFSTAVAAGLQRGSMFLLLFQVVRITTRANGLGETHFGWFASGTKVVRENLSWLGALGIPSAVAVTVLGDMENGEWNDSLGRLAFLGGMVVTAATMHNVFRLKKGMFHEALARGPQSWLNRVRVGGHLAGTGTPCALAVLAAAGYYYSARQLAIRFELTMLIALVLVLAHGVVTRWFLVKRRSMAIKQARERRSQSEALGDAKLVAAPAPVTNLTALQSQLQILLRYTVAVSVLIAGWFVWSDVLPALRVLDRVVLWRTSVTITDVQMDNGKPVSNQRTEEIPTTLTHALLALVLVAGTYVLGRNLPALLEITILERLPMDHGGRHATAIIFRYAVCVTGLCFVARTLNISWSSVQWLAAAITVGLGFGLQEIFANLVSGIIILFERPIRVGDLVTVNGVTGTVTRMQIRATTITDFDRREMIVPNKKFITEDVINWTLSDKVSRVTIQVGVAYGSDTMLAHALLLKVAREHPLVMQDPAPTAVFRNFGESTLDFTLHVFIATRDVYSIVVHELHTAIDREFRQANIEMAYPQRDVNIRSISSSALPAIFEATQTKAA